MASTKNPRRLLEDFSQKLRSIRLVLVGPASPGPYRLRSLVETKLEKACSTKTTEWGERAESHAATGGAAATSMRWCSRVQERRLPCPFSTNAKRSTKTQHSGSLRRVSLRAPRRPPAGEKLCRFHRRGSAACREALALANASL